MPNFNEFHLNMNLLDEVKRIKKNQTNQYVLPIKLPNRVSTIPPDEYLDINDWFEYLRKRKKISKEIC